MALILKDRVLEKSTSTGTGAFALGGAQTGFQSFSVIGSGNTTYYTIQAKNADGTLTGEWEVGTGTYTTGSLSRDTVLESSNANALVNFSSGDKDVFCDLPAEKVLASNGTSSQLLANDGSGGLSNVTIGSNLIYSAGTLSATGGGMTYPSTGIANSTGSAWGTSYGVTGTGSVVLSNSPTLTGSVTANVNLRSGNLSSLLALAGGTSEIGYATDSDTLVKFNGVAGQAEIYGKYTNGTTLNYLLTNANATTPIDCTNVSILNITISPSYTGIINDLYIKLPSCMQAPVNGATNTIPNLTVNVNPPLNAGFGSPITIHLTYNQFDIDNGGNDYATIAADNYNVATGNVPRIYNKNNLDLFLGFSVVFTVATAIGGSWTRFPMPGEGLISNTLPGTGQIGQRLVATGTSVALTSGTIANSSSLTLSAGIWLLTGVAIFTSTNATALAASELLAGIGLIGGASIPNNSPNDFNQPTAAASVQTTSLANIKTLQVAIPTVFRPVAIGPITIFGNARATYSAGTVSAMVMQTAVRIA